jgi:hypothetical protein
MEVVAMHINGRTGSARFRPAHSILALVTAAGLAATTGCYASAKSGGSTETSPSQGLAAAAQPTAQPTGIEVAKGIAQAELGMLAGGDWAGAWELWTTSAKQAMSKADFIALNKECQPKLGVLYEIQDVKPVAALAVAVSWQHAATKGSGTMKYENGSWHYEPDATQLADYRMGAKALIAKRKADKTCTAAAN